MEQCSLLCCEANHPEKHLDDLAAIKELRDQVLAEPLSTPAAKRVHVAKVMRAMGPNGDKADMQQAAVEALAALQGPVPEDRLELLEDACAIRDLWMEIVAGGRGDGAGLGQLDRPSGLALDRDRGLLITDRDNHRVVRWAPGATEGIVVAGGRREGDGLGQLRYPSSLALDRDGGLLIADSGNHRVVRWASGATEGIVVAGGRGEGEGLGQLCYPSSLAVDNDGGLLIADCDNNRVVRWAPGATEGVVVAGGCLSGGGLGQLDSPSGLALDRDGGVLIADSGNHRVVRWAPGATEGIVVAGGRGPGDGLGQLFSPICLALDHNGELLIADCDNHRVVRWVPGDTEGIIVVMEHLHYPQGLALDRNGGLLIADMTNAAAVKYVHMDTVDASAFTTTLALLVSWAHHDVASLSPANRLQLLRIFLGSFDRWRDWRLTLIRAVDGNDNNSAFKYFVNVFYKQTLDDEVDGFIRTVVRPLFADKPDQVDQLVLRIEAHRKQTGKYSLTTILLDTVLPLTDLVLDGIQIVTYVIAKQLQFTALCVSGMIVNTIGTVILEFVSGSWQVAMLNILTLGVWGSLSEARSCYRTGLKSDNLFFYKLLEALESTMSFLVGSYSLEIASHLEGYDALTPLKLALRWAGLASSVACLTKLNFDISARLVFQNEGGSHVRPLLRSWQGKGLIVSFAASEVLALLGLIPFAYAFRPFGIFFFVAPFLVLFVLTAMYMAWQKGRALDATEAVLMVFMSFIGLVMNPCVAVVVDLFAELSRLVVIGKGLLFASAVAATSAKAWVDADVLSAVFDTETWNSIVLFALAVFGLLLYSVTGTLLWRRGFFHQAKEMETGRGSSQ